MRETIRSYYIRTQRLKFRKMSTIVLKALVNMTHTEDREKYNVGGEFVTCNLVNNLVCPPKNA